MPDGKKEAHEPLSGDSPLEALEIKDLGAYIRKAGQKLPPRDWSILKDWFYSQLTYKELSKKHGIAVGSVGVYLIRAYEKLRPLLKKYGITL